MTPDRWQQISEVFNAAMEREPEEREVFLDQACSRDQTLRREVESLITHDEQECGVIDNLPFEIPAQLLSDDSTEKILGSLIGQYKIIREISRGGMGAIYLAARADDQYEKQVAIKLVKRGMDTEFIVRRFLSERQILAGLDHPNIGRLFDGGVTGDGRPYFVMEYIEGLPIGEYCDAHQLDTIKRLELFRTACAAVEYAHQRHVVHRDLKPTNILVTAEGRPKLLDFGIAKLLDPAFTGPANEHTATSERLMTPGYASPEQIRGDAITPASDIYSLGVLLYELLTGHRPYRIKSRSPEELVRLVCEEEPDRPSSVVTRVEVVSGSNGASSITLTPESVSRARDCQPKTLRRQLNGDVDMMVLMAMRKEPERRYQTVKQFSDDIHRHLEGLPVIARKDRLSYRAGKFTHRNRTAIIAAALCVIVFGLAMTLSSFWFARNPVRSEPAAKKSIAVLPLKNLTGDPANEYFSDGVTDSLINALSKIDDLKVISRGSVFRFKGREVDPQEAGRQLRVAAVLEGSVNKEGDKVRVAVRLVSTEDGRVLWATDTQDRALGDIFALQDEIASNLAQGLKIELTGEGRRQLSRRYTVSVEAYEHYLKGRFFWNKRTNEGLNKGIEQFEQALRLDANYALAHAGLADTYVVYNLYSASQLKDALPKAKAAAEHALALDDTLAEAHTALAYVKEQYDWDWPGAEREFKRAIELNPNYPTAHQYYSEYLVFLGRTEEAVREIQRAHELDPLSLIITTEMGYPHFAARRCDLAMEHFRRALELDPNFAFAIYNIALCYSRESKHDEAIAQAQRAIKLSGGGSLMLAGLGIAHARAGHGREARQVISELRLLTRQRYVSPYLFATIHSVLGEKDKALAELENARANRDQFLVILKVDSSLDILRPDPRFQDLLRHVGLASL
ncbi:MAG: protein kinase [Pyrinomonadaceae bacterium]|nr:protein kinase [Pyrinomonadaceae bacterium]